jgi:hypothetical protein
LDFNTRVLRNSSAELLTSVLCAVIRGSARGLRLVALTGGKVSCTWPFGELNEARRFEIAMGERFNVLRLGKSIMYYYEK